MTGDVIATTVNRVLSRVDAIGIGGRLLSAALGDTLVSAADEIGYRPRGLLSGGSRDAAASARAGRGDGLPAQLKRQPQAGRGHGPGRPRRCGSDPAPRGRRVMGRNRA
ncbi:MULTISPECIES: hypothetical protein [unclassified Aureimonas]|uniref:hypothetical protein n=1 Tax=unclassified Aureimonas TaxID=2615206 RepID=UPI000A83A738|nr:MULTISPECIES: hypothetical protein [unclassified Aureimonas]